MILIKVSFTLANEAKSCQGHLRMKMEGVKQEHWKRGEKIFVF